MTEDEIVAIRESQGQCACASCVENHTMDDAIAGRLAEVRDVKESEELNIARSMISVDNDYQTLVDEYNAAEVKRAAEDVAYRVHRESHLLTGRKSGPYRENPNQPLIDNQIQALMAADKSLSYADAAERVSIIFPGWF